MYVLSYEVVRAYSQDNSLNLGWCDGLAGNLIESINIDDSKRLIIDLQIKETLFKRNNIAYLTRHHSQVCFSAFSSASDPQGAHLQE